MKSEVWSRRRVLSSLAVSAAIFSAPVLSFGMRERPVPMYQWRGIALGARATVLIEGSDAARASQLAPVWQAELRRLEAVFSLYREHSSIRQLNRDGGLDAPPLELVDLLATCQTIHRATGGVFDPSVQPVWELYAEHFKQHRHSENGPDVQRRAQVRERVDFEQVRIAADRIEFARPGMALTLNGIAQGYITDRIAALLAREGVRHALIDFGEIRALGPRAGGQDWRVGLAASASDSFLSGYVDLREGAIATSSSTGFQFGGHKQHHHLFDTHLGESATAPRNVSIQAPNATLADGLATALAMLPVEKSSQIAAKFSGVVIHNQSPIRINI